MVLIRVLFSLIISVNSLLALTCFIQESWLSPSNLYKLNNFNNNYSFFGISAMEEIVSHSILKGRPHGGVCCLVQNKFRNNIKYVECKERFVVLVIDECIFVNVYLPSVKNQDDSDLLSSILCDIDSVLDEAVKTLSCSDFNMFVGGDMNTNLNVNCKATNLINEFIDNWLLISCDKIIPSNLNYTYFHETLQSYSHIDFFLIRRLNNNIKLLKDFKILDDPCNLSDHLPIKIEVNIKLNTTKQKTSADISGSFKSDLPQLDWGKGDKTIDFFPLNSFKIN